MVQFATESNQLVCRFEGQLDTAACQEWGEALIKQVQAARQPVVFDLHGISYVASMFLRLCVQAAKEVGAGNFSLVNVTPPVKRVFMMAGLDKQLNVQ